MLEQRFSRGFKGDYGSITVCNVDTTTVDFIRTWCKDHPSCRLGAMGSRAKSLSEQENFPLDFTYGVIDKCILRALIGESSLILTSEGMVKRVERRVLEFDGESGISIPVHDLKEKVA